MTFIEELAGFPDALKSASEALEDVRLKIEKRAFDNIRAGGSVSMKVRVLTDDGVIRTEVSFRKSDVRIRASKPRKAKTYTIRNDPAQIPLVFVSEA